MTGPHFCQEVREEVNFLAQKMDVILEKTYKIGTQVAVLVDREKPPCEKYGERISKLEDTKSSLRGVWKVLGIIGGVVLGLCSIGGIVIATIMLLK